MTTVVQGSGAMLEGENGPKPFMAELKVMLGGVEHEISWPSEQSLVSVMIEASLAPPHSCLVGKCGACVCTIVGGRVGMEFNEVLDADDMADGYVLGCQARPLTALVEITFD